MTRSVKFWNRTAKKYDRREKGEEGSLGGYLERLRKYLKKSDSVLDLGCGTGLIAMGLSADVKNIRAIDTSSELIKLAKNTAAERIIRNIDFECSDIYSIDVAPGSFDAVLALYLFHLIEDLPPVLERIDQLLKPGGLLLVSMPCMGGKYKFLSMLLVLLSKLDIVPPVKAYTVGQIRNLLADGGFEVVQTELIDKLGDQYFIVGRKK